ncbi:hypothetical protein [Dyella silvatica]|uniref:hypothetical protein n=1 Tax=Dyella silvatica TaxID=2992128 RepID=UPI00224CE88C|nr:hypothetical protein [Dyella silvatica]
MISIDGRLPIKVMTCCIGMVGHLYRLKNFSAIVLGEDACCGSFIGKGAIDLCVSSIYVVLKKPLHGEDFDRRLRWTRQGISALWSQA